MAKAIYTEERQGSPSRLTQTDVISLERIIRTNFDDEDSYFRISTKLPNADVEAKCSEDFFQSNLLPDTIKSLSLYCSDYSSSRQNRNVRVSFYSASTRIEVVGEDQEWVIGRCEAIVRFLKERRPWYWPFIRFFESWALQLLLIPVFPAINLLLIRTINTASSTIIYYTLAVGWVIMYIFHWIGTFSRTKIYVRPKIKNESKMQMQIAVIGVIFTILSVVVPVILWFLDRNRVP